MGKQLWAAWIGVVLSGMPATAQTGSPPSSSTIHLSCHPSGDVANIMSQDGPTVIDLNESQSWATIHFASYVLKGMISGPIPARTVGPMPAKFSDETVTFDNPDPNSAPHGGQDEYILSRITLELRGKWGQDAMACQVAQKQI